MVKWRSWSSESFAEAKNKKKIILLDLSASWCHWCHVMDETTYTNPDVARKINSDFVPVRVDIDRRPDISERYNRGGFPTTAFLSDQGESIWGATYVPPVDMMRIMTSILAAQSSGEIDEALEKGRMMHLDGSKVAERGPPIGDIDLQQLFEDIFSSYDVVHGGFGVEPKFPHPDAIDLMLWKYRFEENDELASAVRNTLNNMYKGLGDQVEGGVFRYSVTRDWGTPHYEKMLETNIGFIRNTSGAYAVLRDEKFRKMASEVVSYLVNNLLDAKTGGFFGSQDADEEYYRLEADSRRKRKAPDIDRTTYAGWNCGATSVMLNAGAILGDAKMIDVGGSAFGYVKNNLRDHKTGLVRHVSGSDLFLFDDQVAFLGALLAMTEISDDHAIPEMIESLIGVVDHTFSHENGGFGDVARDKKAIGELDSPRKSLMANSTYASHLALCSVSSQRPELLEKANQILDSFTFKTLENHGLFASTYVLAKEIVKRGPTIVEVESTEEDPLSDPLWMTAKADGDPSRLTTFRRARGKDIGSSSARICTLKACMAKVTDAQGLKDALRIR